jgi:RHS repeat-associated protein
MDYSYTYDDADNITVKTTEHGTYNYTYDDLYRLTAATNPDKPADGFTYDPAGNRLTSAAFVGEWKYNNNNELNDVGWAEGRNPTIAYAFDANGNTVKKTENSTVTDYSWDAENRLMKVDKAGAVAGAYYYDPFGRRLSKTANGVTTYYLYSDEGLAGEFNASGQALKTYGFAPNSTWTTDPLFMKAGSNYYFYHNDHLGTPQKMTAVNGAIVWSAKYEAFGKATIDAGASVENNLRFPGQYFDQETGEHYNWNRYYEAGTGRYGSVDPIGNVSGLNLFIYVSSNPINLLDIYGLFDNGTKDGADSTPNKGHSDFRCGSGFDFTKEDHGWTHPWWPWSWIMEWHFKNIDEANKETDKDIAACDKNNFERHMHWGQDYFSHVGAGFGGSGEHVFKPTKIDTDGPEIWMPILGGGHRGTKIKVPRITYRPHWPDDTIHNPVAIKNWNDADDWTCERVTKWNDKCKNKCTEENG